MSLPIAIHSVAQVRALDRYAIEQLGISAYALMTRAGEVALAALRGEWPLTKRVLVVCGAGNNAGDGYVLARLVSAAGLQVRVVSLCDVSVLSGAAHQALQDFLDIGGELAAWPTDLAWPEVIVDALFGTGLSRALDERLIACVQALNHSGRPILALDVPSGLQADTGMVMGAAIHAQRTLCFIGLKQGFYLGEGPNHIGKLLFDDLGVPVSTAPVGCTAQRLEHGVVAQALPRRARTTHKGQQGHVLIVGGGPGMGGAVRLSAEACLRSGAGLVSVVTHPVHLTALLAGRPELMCHGVLNAADIAVLLEAADVIAIGPGLGQDAWAHDLFNAVMQSGKPLVMDADALNLLAHAKNKNADRVIDESMGLLHRDNWVLTPHPGEAARLLHTDTTQVQAARLWAVQELVARFGGTVVLKGAGTLVMNKSTLPMLCDRGNPGMAVPGMGDVLTGIIAGIAAQCGELPLAARAGVYVHAMAGDMAARHGERGILASDVFAHLSSCINP